MNYKIILVVIELMISLFFILPLFSGIVNFGNILGMLICGILLAVTVFNKQLCNLISVMNKNILGKITVWSIGIITAVCVVYAVVLTIFMFTAKSDKPNNPKAVVVLGCKVKGEEPSKMLKRRLDSAVIYMNENKDMICIVSGGKGDDEHISEAEAMKNYMVKKGVSAERIMMEDKSVNTYENLKNSLGMLYCERGEVAIVTDGFHQYRAGFIAKSMGWDASAVNSQMDIFNLSISPTYYVREWLAITNEYVKYLKK